VKHLLQTRVPGQGWHTHSTAETRWDAAVKAQPAVEELRAQGHRDIGVRVVSQAAADRDSG
jgi:hypothetical protein